MSEGHFTRSQVSANRCLRQGADSARDTIRDIFTNAALANGSSNVQQTEIDLYRKIETYDATLPVVLKPSLMDVDFFAETEVGWVHAVFRIEYRVLKGAGPKKKSLYKSLEII
ncbi:unnamed protein product [Fusarium venenatum]|uniref:Uncharacterized protein n=1 Tax=Fusarium venenatum TaxID=56646 RepID=A0A2L2TU41_9HYPO|nr:uncharacterized protein FVRRES_04138 [Fusarium venenatum]CEI67626.1 unnamed protein product [Fusarium venenatum]